MKPNRRGFLSASLATAFAQSRGPAQVILDHARHKDSLDRRVLGAFLEQLGRTVYEGVYDPKSPLADAKALAVPIMRYPGPATTGSTASARRITGRRSWSVRGIRSRPTSSCNGRS